MLALSFLQRPIAKVLWQRLQQAKAVLLVAALAHANVALALSTSSSLVQRTHAFDAIYNFRPVGAAQRIFRSAALEAATAEDLRKLTTELNVKSIIDLRGEDERRMLWQTDFGSLFDRQSSSVASEADRQIYHISLLETERYYRGIYATWPAYRQAYVAAIGAFSRRAETAIFVDCINAGGLPELYTMLLCTAQEDICRVLKIMADEGNHPVVFHCAKGKDRTGLIAMLLQSVLGDSAEQIVNGYAASDALLRLNPEETMREGGPPKRGQIDWSNFEGSPPEVMVGVLKHLDKRYGGVTGYLDAIGFDEAWRCQLRAACAP
ncbi:protein-tyrosine phosphatase-like protein [Tribonema minus]|uniref:Protein-tyrosine phosphatase-like protein n=1 Tax=Tribonema minus TaxID=303371 RepID=A0A835YRA7_9STRA|nr:protein-tyrosine phosphatase-like protein [Tribonema minus]